ncbi:MAG: GNAT family N-acetyltransferase [Roseiflexaceae bacterium]|jgi:mycothiol synthase
MSRYHIRTLHTPEEFADVLRFSAHMAIQQEPYRTCMPGDLAWWRSATPDDSGLAQLQVWLRDNTIVAWTWQNDDQIDSVIDSSDPHLWPSLVEYVAAQPQPVALWAYDQQPQRTAVLAAHGFVACDSTLNLNEIRTTQAPIYAMPQGWHVETLQIADTHSRVTAQHSAFQSTKMTAARYDFMRQHPGYTPAWDMVAKHVDGDIDAFCTVWVDTWSGYALFEPVGCRQMHQRKGITRGLISATLQRLADAGIRMASVMSDGYDNNPAQHLYVACGFRWVDKLRMWRRAGQ